MATDDSFYFRSVTLQRLRDRTEKDESWLWNADDNEPVVSPDLSSPRRRSTVSLQRKPTPNDPLQMKEEYIRLKYVDKAYMEARGMENPQQCFWNSILSADYRGIIACVLYGANANEVHRERLSRSVFDKREQQARAAATAIYGRPVDPVTDKARPRAQSSTSGDPDCGDLGLTALHIMSELKDATLLLLLTLWTDDINVKDAYKRTPVHYCILNQWDEGAKILLKRGAAKDATDVYGITALEMAMGRGQLTDEDLFSMLAQG